MTSVIRRRQMAFGLCLLIGVAAVAGARRKDKPATTQPARPRRTRPLVVGFCQIGSESSWRAAQSASIKAEAKKRGITLRFVDAMQRQENQIKALRAMAAQKVDVIAFSPVVATGWEPVLREIKKAGIPVILVDRDVTVSDPSLYATCVASDFVEQGRRAAKWLVRNTKGQVRVFVLAGTPGSAAALDRGKGFVEVVAKQPRIKMVGSLCGNFMRSKGKEVMAAFLATQASRAVNVVFAHNDDMAVGAIQAIKAAGRKPGTDIKVVSIDAVKAAFEAMVAGELNCTVECNPEVGPQLFDAVEALVDGVLDGKPLPKRITVKERVFDQSTAKKLLPHRPY